LADSGFDFAGKKAFVFITSGGAPAKSLWHLSQAVTKTGASVIGGIQLRGCSSFPTLFGLFPGRPDEKDLERAENFGHALESRILFSMLNSISFFGEYKLMKLTYSGAGGGGGSGGNAGTKGISQSAQVANPFLYSVLHFGQYMI